MLGQQVGVRHPEPAKVLLGEIDATACAVFGDVLPVLGQLERGADLIRQRDPLGRRDADRREHQAPDRVGRQRAVGPQVVERLIAAGSLIEAVGFDEPPQRLFGEPARVAGADEGNDCGQLRAVAGQESGDVGVDEIEQLQLAGGLESVVVADVVDEPRVAVDRHQIRAQLGGQEPGGDRKVLRAGLGEHALEAGQRRDSCGHRRGCPFVRASRHVVAIPDDRSPGTAAST